MNYFKFINKLKHEHAYPDQRKVPVFLAFACPPENLRYMKEGTMF